MNRFNTLVFFFFLAAVFTFSSCKKDTVEPSQPPAPAPGPSYTIPTTYSFSNADFTSSTQRIAMLGEITNYLRSTHTTTASVQPTLSAQTLKNMYANTASAFSDANLNSSGIQLKNKTGSDYSFVAELESAFEDAELASVASAANPTASTASNGVRGKLVTASRAVLVNANGFEYKEIAEKGLMGAVFYFQAMNLIHNISSYDNTIPVNNSTAQEKAWDEAFGYFGVPVSFPTTTVGLKNWGSYCNSVNPAIGSNSLIMNAFLKGRAAISNKDNTGRDEAKFVVVTVWEKVAAAKCISYLKGAKSNLSDVAALHHNLSEAYGFVTGFRYNSQKTISEADILQVLNYIGTNLYQLNPANLDLAIAKLESVFKLNAALIP